MSRYLFLVHVAVLVFSGYAIAEHPSLLARAQDHGAICSKLQKAPWAKTAFESLKAQSDHYLELCANDPTYFSSRLFLHWRTHFITPVVKDSRWVGGEGRATGPTARFAGARDWTTKYSVPGKLEDLKPFNENEQGQIWLLNKDTGKEEWADSGQTGRIIEVTNARLIQAAAEVSFIYWITGDERYAAFASEILWTYMQAFSQVTAPRLPPGDKSMAPIIGMTSFEVIHEDIVTYLGISYDFLNDYLKKQGRDVILIQTGLKRMIDRVIEGGNRDGNWNLHQARITAYGGLPLEGNDAYADAKGREYYVDIVLNADLPHQLGIARVIHKSLDENTALWAEAPGYGFGAVGDLVLIASLAASDPAAQRVLADPLLAGAALAQANLIYPNGLSIGLGDTSNTRINTLALELLMANARSRSDSATEEKLSAALFHEMQSGAWDRGKNVNLFSLTHFLDEIRVGDAPTVVSRTFFGKPLNVFIQRSPGKDANYGLAAAMYGTDGGHVHANGLAIELYGAGLILGADPGRGTSYWQKDHSEYYLQPPAHNTVIVNGKSDYPPHGEERQTMTVEACDPRPGESGSTASISFVQGSFRYSSPSAKQQRTLALVRLSPTHGFYLDVFRSRSMSEEGSFHDYLYHNIGQSVSLRSDSGEAVRLSESSELVSSKGLLKGYDYFKHERSVETSDSMRAVFTADVKSRKHRMDFWMAGAKGRRIFVVDAPQNRAIREALPPSYSTMPMPTVVVRQKGDAWNIPFVAVYEPYLDVDGPSIRSVRSISTDVAGVVICQVKGVIKGDAEHPFTAYLYQSDRLENTCTIDGLAFSGRLGVVVLEDAKIVESYSAK